MLKEQVITDVWRDYDGLFHKLNSADAVNTAVKGQWPLLPHVLLVHLVKNILWVLAAFSVLC